MFIEVHHEDLVLRIAGAREGQAGVNDLRALRPHTSAVIHHQAGRDRYVFMAEILDLLRNAVFVNLEILLG